ncbi:hypothetical protein [Bacillus niameyensis]|uniref:hypothetical protein n=1 Tax=Bacillus niameyensis TaxID=1522308 RepID=UPI0007829C5F|nr:hypothetical protein [Bacillus niameyensis]
MKKLLLILTLAFSFLVQLPELVTAKQDFPNNESKSFTDANTFYEQLDKKIYKEYKNSAYSIRKKILFKDVPNAIWTFNQKTKNGCQAKEDYENANINPNRQVYFLGTFSQNNDEEFHKYTVIDAETKQELLGGTSYHHYDDPYKK